jgi:hypothetical protein
MIQTLGFGNPAAEAKIGPESNLRGDEKIDPSNQRIFLRQLWDFS